MKQLRDPERALSFPEGRAPDGPLILDSRARNLDTAAERRRWRGTYVRRLLASDALCAVLAAAAGYLVRFGPASTGAATASKWVAVLLPAVWVFSMALARTYEERFLWTGPEEFRRVFLAAALLLATVGTVSWAVKLEVARGLVVIALPLATVTTLGLRCTWRRLLWFRRRRGQCLQRTLLVGHPSDVAALHAQIKRQSSQGYQVIGCCLAGAADGSAPVVPGIPVLGNLDAVDGVVRRYEVDTVTVLPCPQLAGAALRQLAWNLEATAAELLLAPAVTEIVGARVQLRRVFGLPLVHLDRPELRGVRRMTKSVFDRSAALFVIVALTPVLLGVAILVKATSPGPVLFRQERVGRHGSTFRMLKFRTMVDGADRMLEMLSDDNDGNGVLFKMKADPRVTGIGAVLRRYSLDELPQLVNVLRGEMSLVGPRPPLPQEVDRYGFDMHRRFLVKPGLTGLWQISGRSNLSWDESVRADVMYVENWSLTFDLLILWRTVGAVLRGSGAY
jgi:exopolysaccharide biosynthesis polyprenyl glycosylphosphotransferase